MRRHTATCRSARLWVRLFSTSLQAGRQIMNTDEQQTAKQQVLAAFERGCSVQNLLRTSAVPLHRATVYRLRQRFETDPETALSDGRHGHASKLRDDVRAWLQEYCQTAPGCRSQTVQTALYERFAIHVSIAHLNRVRASLGLSRRSPDVEKNQPRLSSEPTWQECAGSLLLLQAARETGLLSALEGALPKGEQVPHRLAHATPTTRRQSLLTLLFLGAVSLRRTCDLKRYTGDGLGLLTGCRRAYGFWHTERFLSQVARSGGDETLTDALAAWTSKLWSVGAPPPCNPAPSDLTWMGTASRSSASICVLADSSVAPAHC